MTVRQRILPSVSQLHQSAAFVTFHHHSIIMGDDNPDWIMRGCAICSGIMVFIILFLTIACKHPYPLPILAEGQLSNQIMTNPVFS